MPDLSPGARYPAIVSRINDLRPPDRSDVRKVALRAYREIGEEGASRFRRLRRAVAISRAALGVTKR